jgi:hypothetical protein
MPLGDINLVVLENRDAFGLVELSSH